MQAGLLPNSLAVQRTELEVEYGAPVDGQSGQGRSWQGAGGMGSRKCGQQAYALTRSVADRRRSESDRSIDEATRCGATTRPYS
jgi:hypothetical protein